MERSTGPSAVKPWLLVICFGLVAAGGMATACSRESETRIAFDAELKSEMDAHLPKGASVRDVESWLASKGFEHSGLIDNAKLAHMGHDPNIYEIKALIPGTKRIELVHTDTQMTFVFDRGQKLVGSRVEAVHTGL